MAEQPKIPTDQPTSWTVDENGEWTEVPFLTVGPAEGTIVDSFDTSDLGPIPFKEGHMLGGVWSGTGEGEDFTVKNDD